MSLGNHISISIDFLNRLWSNGGQIFDEFGRVTLNSGSARNALQSLMQTYRYCSGEPNCSWDEVAEEFSRGQSAMVVLYNSDVGYINNYTKSKVAGNLGYSMVPGGVSVLGGWSLGLNRYGRHQEEAERFLLWGCSKENGVLLALLGGSTLRKEYYEHSNLENHEPWKNLILESAAKGRKRKMPEIYDDSRLKNNIYTTIIPSEIIRVMHGEISEEQALANMEEQIQTLIRGV
jgi:ABC-type glycerol-3-phosphate transport system substrate-binding protein